MPRAEGSIVINRPLEEVFDYVSNVDNFPEWAGGAIEVHEDEPGRLGKAIGSPSWPRYWAADSRIAMSWPLTSPLATTSIEVRAVRSLIRSGPIPLRR